MSDSVWKKEISFKRKPKGEEVELEAPKQSFLKKEISFSRKPKAAKEVDARETPKAAKESFLKKEISFSRKPKAAKEVDAPETPKAAKESFLKKEVSFSRKKRDKEIERLVQEAEQTVAPAFAPAEVVASTELPPTALAEAAVAAMTESPAVAPAAEVIAEAAPAEVAPVAERIPVEVAPEPVALAAVPDVQPTELYAVAPLPAETFADEPEPFAAADDVIAVPVLPVDEAPVEPISTLAPAILPASAVEPTAEPVAAEPVAVEPVAEAWLEPVAAPEPVEPWLSAPELPPASETAAAVLVHPPVPASALPPLPDAGPKTPFWKKELSLSRTPKAKKAKTPKAERAPKADSGPFWKKELSFGRKPRAAQEAPAAADAPSDAPTEVIVKPASQPFWKKQVSFGGRKGGHAAKKLVGLKVGASQLAAARVSNNGVVELQQVARDALAPGIVVGGELRDPDALGEALKIFFAKHKLPRKGVRLGIASNRIGVRTFDIVGVDQEKQLTNAVQFRAQEALPIPLDEAVLDYHVLSESVDEEGQTVKRVLLVVAYRELIERYVSACRIAGITLAGIDLEAFALLRALAAPVDRGAAALVAVAIGHDRSTFAVSDGRVCEFTRVLEWGGSSLSVALARVFDSTPSEVEAIKRSLTLNGTATPAGLTEEQAALALDAVKRQVQSFARELVSSLQFYQNQPGSLGIGEIVLTGGTTGLPGLAEELERLIGVHVRVGDPLARVKVAKHGAETDQIGSLAVAIGLGIED
jgi:type IV pilus assembly protein PilM